MSVDPLQGIPSADLENPLTRRATRLQCTWSERYGQRHQLVRITVFPEGIRGPAKVRIYRRQEHFVLQWWDPAAKTNLSDRVDGDLVSAISRARQIEERVIHFKASGQVSHRRLHHHELVEAFVADLQQRANAEEVDPATVLRYESALAHYLAFCQQPAITKEFPNAAGVNREFRLKLVAFLAQRQVTSNGRAQAEPRPMKGQDFILDTVRALFEWAADAERGHLLPEGFRNPFLRVSKATAVLRGDPLAEPDITLGMAIDFINACDPFQLRLFAPMLLFGLRAAEPCYLFAEYLEQGWLRVPCNPDLGYLTKGRREKRFPLLEDLQPLWQDRRSCGSHGLLYERRAVCEGKDHAPLRGISLAKMIAEFQRRCGNESSLSAAKRQEIRNRLLWEAGGITYDHVQGEFERLARRLKWSRRATLKDLRHLFATTMNNAAMPEAYANT